jgi:type III pantothenate kinase
MTLLAVDVGNTQTLLGLFQGEDLAEHWRVATEAHRTADELAVVLRGLLAGRSVDPDGGGIDGIVLCSTVPSVLHEMRLMCARYYPGVPTVVVEPGVRTGVPVLTDNPKEVGTDRVVNALAAVAGYGGPCVVVDFGTATTFDAVSAAGEYLGGAIAPGIEVSVDALNRRGAQLRDVELVPPRSVIGRSTVEALQAGIVYGFAGLVDGVVARICAELVRDGDGDEDDVTVIATGGLAPLVLDEVAGIDVHDPWLTLTGLRLVFERNGPQARR